MPEFVTPFRFTARATASVAHGDAGAGSAGANNTVLFARELTLLRGDVLTLSHETVRDALSALCTAQPLPESAFLRQQFPKIWRVVMTEFPELQRYS